MHLMKLLKNKKEQFDTLKGTTTKKLWYADLKSLGGAMEDLGDAESESESEQEGPEEEEGSSFELSYSGSDEEESSEYEMSE